MEEHSDTQQKQRLIPKGLGVVVMILLIVCTLAWISLWRPWQPVNREQLIVEPINKKVETPATSPNGNKTHYEFYDLLAKQQVSPVPEKPMTQVNDTSNATAYAEVKAEDGQNMQSFALITQLVNSPDIADEQRNKLQMMGYPSDVVMSNNEKGEIIYRVMVGPFATKYQAEQGQKSLKQQGIDSVLSELSPKLAQDERR